MHQPHSPAPPSPASCEDCRCPCGSLLARVIEGGVELKCRRCKRTVVLPLSEPSERRPARLVLSGEAG
jgi:phage FluMu protein Com